MSNRWITLLLAVVIAIVLVMGLLMRRQDPVTPATNHTEHVAPQAMLWSSGHDQSV